MSKWKSIEEIKKKLSVLFWVSSRCTLPRARSDAHKAEAAKLTCTYVQQQQEIMPLLDKYPQAKEEITKFSGRERAERILTPGIGVIPVQNVKDRGLLAALLWVIIVIAGKCPNGSFPGYTVSSKINTQKIIVFSTTSWSSDHDILLVVVVV